MGSLINTNMLLMPPAGIPEQTLIDWSAQGAVTTAKASHERVREVIDAINFQYRKPLVYLQGSYGNTTNIRASSDVDVVVEWWVPQEYACSGQDEVNLFLWYKKVIVDALAQSFSGVKSDKKCIRVPRTTNTVPADVVPAFFIRPWNDFVFLQPNIKPSNAMKFYVAEERRWVTNYPKSHDWNGTDKNKRTNGYYKPMVRIFKNALKHAGYSCFPGYFTECLLFNVPDHLFWGMGYRKKYQDIVSWLYHANKSLFSCQNGQVYLFGNTPEQWNISEAEQAILCWSAIWNEYRS